jgi:hypothetical protein
MRFLIEEFNNIYIKGKLLYLFVSQSVEGLNICIYGSCLGHHIMFLKTTLH